jgi:hypothetical protein
MLLKTNPKCLYSHRRTHNPQVLQHLYFPYSVFRSWGQLRSPVSVFSFITPGENELASLYLLDALRAMSPWIQPRMVDGATDIINDMLRMVFIAVCGWMTVRMCMRSWLSVGSPAPFTDVSLYKYKKVLGVTTTQDNAAFGHPQSECGQNPWLRI